nr:MAG TPA: hypothetical protein [Caudoviricetes sp.]
MLLKGALTANLTVPLPRGLYYMPCITPMCIRIIIHLTYSAEEYNIYS